MGPAFDSRLTHFFCCFFFSLFLSSSPFFLLFSFFYHSSFLVDPPYVLYPYNTGYYLLADVIGFYLSFTFVLSLYNLDEPNKLLQIVKSLLVF